MTTCVISKFVNVTPQQLAALMSLVGSDANTGRCRIDKAVTYGDEPRHQSIYGEVFTYRHISVLSVEESKEVDGRYTVNVRVNSHLEPILGDKHAGWRIKPSDKNHWSNRADYAPVPVPQSLILAMHTALGIFPAA